MSDRRRQWRHNRDWHYTDEELAREEVARENEAAMIHKPLVFVEEDLPQVHAEHDRDEAKF